MTSGPTSTVLGMATPILGLAELQEASPLAHVIANTNFRVLEAYARKYLSSDSLTAPPGSPTESAIYFVASTATGDWAGYDGQLVIYIQGTWVLLGDPITGERWNVAGTWKEWDGSTWGTI